MDTDKEATNERILSKVVNRIVLIQHDRPRVHSADLKTGAFLPVYDYLKIVNDIVSPKLLQDILCNNDLKSVPGSLYATCSSLHAIRFLFSFELMVETWDTLTALLQLYCFVVLVLYRLACMIGLSFWSLAPSSHRFVWKCIVGSIQLVVLFYEAHEVEDDAKSVRSQRWKWHW